MNILCPKGKQGEGGGMNTSCAQLSIKHLYSWQLNNMGNLDLQSA